MTGIYNIRNNVDDKIYIGSAVNIDDRWRGHKFDLNKNKHHSDYLQKSWNKHGKNNFEFEIIEYVNDKQQLIKREQNWIDFFKPQYNICKNAGNNLGYKHTEESKNKMSIIRKGRKLSKEWKKKISLWNIGRKHTEKSKTKMSLMKKGHEVSKKTRLKIGLINKGKKFSDEIRKKMSIAHKGNKHTEESKNKMSESRKNKKPVLQFDVNGNFIKEYCSISQAAKINHIGVSDISDVCKNKNHHITVANYKWKYK